MLGLHRRDMLRIGSLTLGTGLLANSRPALASGTASPQQSTVKSVIMLWMGGGVTHIDSFDPKPDAPEEIRGTLTDIATCLPGVRFCETMPQLSRIADQLAVLRTFSHDSNDHLLSQVYTLSGRKVARNQLFSEPNIGSIISFLHGPRNGLPGTSRCPGSPVRDHRHTTCSSAAGWANTTLRSASAGVRNNRILRRATSWTTPRRSITRICVHGN